MGQADSGNGNRDKEVRIEMEISKLKIEGMTCGHCAAHSAFEHFASGRVRTRARPAQCKRGERLVGIRMRKQVSPTAVFDVGLQSKVF